MVRLYCPLKMTLGDGTLHERERIVIMVHANSLPCSGGNDGLRRLAEAWHKRVIADEVVAHAFSHGFHPQHTERLATYWA